MNPMSPMTPYFHIMRVRAGEVETTEYGDMGVMASMRPAAYTVRVGETSNAHGLSADVSSARRVVNSPCSTPTQPRAR